MTLKPSKSADFETTRRPHIVDLPSVLWTFLLLLSIGAALFVAPHKPKTPRHTIHEISTEEFAARRQRRQPQRRQPQRKRRRQIKVPYGMAPQAYKDYIRACARARINPRRISQTIGNHPRSVGYHKRDGVVVQNRRRIAYSAALDIDTDGLRPHQIRRLCVSLAREGFAAFYRRGDAWKGDEHIHAVYGAVKMKPQLQGQVRQFLRERRANGFRRLWWVRKFLRRNGS